MGQQMVTQEGAFTRTTKDIINDNFSELYGTQVGGALDDGQILVGDANDTAAPVDMSGDAVIANDGAVTVTGVNGAAVTADGTAIDATVDAVALGVSGTFTDKDDATITVTDGIITAITPAGP